MSGRFFKGERCGVDNCRSRKYVEDNGNRYCEFGHQHAGSTQRAEDEDEWNIKGQTTKRKQEKQEKVSKHLHGREALELYLYCYQVILWKQSHWLVHSKGLPAELEVLIRDLWALRLQHLKTKIEITSDTESQSQLFSSQSEGATDTEHEEQQQSRRGRRADSTPKLIDTLGLCYFGMLLLRLPASLGDLYEWAANGEMIYYNAKESVPREMRDRLSGTYHAGLDPTTVFKPEDLQTAILDLAISYHRDFGMAIPPLNYPLLLFRYLKDLALPLEIYPATLRLARLVGYNFTFLNFSKRRLRLSDLPEAQLITLLIVAVKLHYPFDGMDRNPYSSTNAGAVVMDWQTWMEAATDFDDLSKAPGRLTFQQNMKITEKDIMSLDDMELDDYLNWYENTWIGKEPGTGSSVSDFQHQLFKMFPTRPVNGQEIEPLPQIPSGEALEASKEQRLRTVQSALKPVGVVPEQEDEDTEPRIKRPGSYYKRYRSPEDLDGVAKAFYEVAAKQAGMSLKSLVKGVFLVERKLEKWVDRERKREAGVEVEDEMIMEQI